MVKVEMYRSFDGKIFENRENCAAYEEENQRKKQYEKLKEIMQKLNDYCETCDDCKDCIFERNCADIHQIISRGIKNFEDE